MIDLAEYLKGICLMKYPMYAIRDEKTSFFLPQVAQTEGDAIRNFAMMVNNPSGVIGFSPKDFDLFLVGYYESQKGELESVSPIELIVNGTSLIGVKDA